MRDRLAAVDWTDSEGISSLPLCSTSSMIIRELLVFKNGFLKTWPWLETVMHCREMINGASKASHVPCLELVCSFLYCRY
jgi:hypothetical protein